MAASRRSPAPSTTPEPLIRLAFKEGDLQTLITKLEDAGIDREIEPIFRRLQKRLADHRLKS